MRTEAEIKEEIEGLRGMISGDKYNKADRQTMNDMILMLNWVLEKPHSSEQNPKE